MKKQLWVILVLVAMLIVPAVLAQNDGGYRFVFAWGREGSGPGQLNFPRAIAIGPDGRVYVADSENHRVQVFTTDGTFVTGWGGYGGGSGQFDVPQGIAVDARGNVYVSDRNNSRIQKFTTEGEFITAWGSPGSGNGQFVEPRNLAVDTAGNVYVADSQNHRVQKFAPDGSFISAWGGPGSGSGQFNYATGVAVSAQGTVYVCDAENHRIQQFSTDGRFIGMWGSQGGGPGQFDRPYSVTVDAQGFVYVVDEWNNRIQKFTADGEFITMWGGPGSENGQFQYPHGVAVDQQGLAYVVDEWNHRIQVFRPEGTPSTPPPTDEPAPDTAPSPVPQATRPPAPIATARATAVVSTPVEAFDVFLLGHIGETLYVEDFQDNAANGWTLEPDWVIMQDPTGNYVLSAYGPGRADLDADWGQLALTCRVRITAGELVVAYRPAEGRTVHALALDATGARLYLRQVPDPATLLVQAEMPIPLETWFELAVISDGSRIQVYVDGALWIDITSPDLPSRGRVGFLGPEMGEVWIDDVTISALE